MIAKNNKCGRGLRFKVSKIENQRYAVQSTLWSTRNLMKMSKNPVNASQGLLTGWWTTWTRYHHACILQWLKFLAVGKVSLKHEINWEQQHCDLRTKHCISVTPKNKRTQSLKKVGKRNLFSRHSMLRKCLDWYITLVVLCSIKLARA